MGSPADAPAADTQVLASSITEVDEPEAVAAAGATSRFQDEAHEETIGAAAGGGILGGDKAAPNDDPTGLALAFEQTGAAVDNAVPTVLGAKHESSAFVNNTFGKVELDGKLKDSDLKGNFALMMGTDRRNAGSVNSRAAADAKFAELSNGTGRRSAVNYGSEMALDSQEEKYRLSA